MSFPISDTLSNSFYSSYQSLVDDIDEEELPTGKLLCYEIYMDVMSDFRFDEDVRQRQDMRCEEESPELLAEFLQIAQQIVMHKITDSYT